MILAILLSATAFATAGFDPTTPAAEFTGIETYDQAGELKLWSRVERIEDPDRSLFAQEAFNRAISWPDEADWAPWIATCFGTNTPHSSAALLHMGPNESVASGTPILLVPGAGDNGVRAYVTLGTRLDRDLRPVYALTFAHPHGDIYMQAEIIADAIARIRARTGAEQVDVVAHSKGGIALAVYLANGVEGDSGATWLNTAYNEVGTRYRGDVRRAVFVATPLGGIDTAFRWPAANLAGLVAEDALSPTSWTLYYPYSTAVPTISTSLADQYIGGSGADWFPGHRQILRRWDDVYDLPAVQPWLGPYALQPDWSTTWNGGLGAWSYSEGIDVAIDNGGRLLDRIEARGIDPAVEVYLLAGRNPLMPNGTQDWLASIFGETWAELVGSSLDLWGALVAEVVDNRFAGLGVTEGEVQGLASGNLVLGEVSGESDGLVFVDSALQADTLTARGARVVESAVVDLSHVDLLYASPVTGELLEEAAGDDPQLQWMAALGQRYAEADTLGWIERVLADDAGGGDTGGTDTGGADTGGPDGGTPDGGTAADGGAADTGGVTGGAGDPAPDESGVTNGGCGRCSSTRDPGTGGAALLLVLAAIRRRRRPGARRSG
ncbi:MAG: hypothetical protein D6798_10875 [Deltaproteobacteria bacterium]|nr:MAG: hypothetical protein D6798_10875 [Deltaproteobacteria bacterium]